MFREWLDRFLLSDHEWKKKYCPNLYHYLFEMTPEERSECFKNNSPITFPSENVKCLIDDINYIVTYRDKCDVDYFWDKTHHLT